MTELRHPLSRARASRPPRSGGRALLPTTRLGRWALALAVAGLLLTTFMWPLLPLGAFPGLICSLVGGGLALRAIFRHAGRDRSFAVIAAVVPFANAVVLVIGEVVVGLLGGH
jgi:hypothetical protein